MTPTRALALLSLALTGAAFAQTADLSMEFTAQRHEIAGPSTRYRAGDFIVYSIIVRNLGPDAAKNVTLDVDYLGEIDVITGSYLMTCTKTRPTRCTAPEIPANGPPNSISIWTHGPVAAGDYTAFAAMSSSTPDPNPSNNKDITLRFTVVAAPDLYVVTLPLPARMQPKQESSVTLTISNLAPAVAAHDVRVSISATEGARISALSKADGPPGLICSASGGVGLCTLPTMPANGFFTFRATLQAPDRNTGATLSLSAVATEAEADFNFLDNSVSRSTTLVRQLVVLNTTDGGAGSLRQALLDADSACRLTPCRVAFQIRLSNPPAWFTIYPLTPLPPIRGIVEIDGSTQSAVSPNAGAADPRIEIRGVAQKQGDDGLLVDGACEAVIRGLAINGFAGQGIVAGGRVPPNCNGIPQVNLIEGNVFGLDPSGLNAVPNTRGIFITDSYTATIRNNRIAANRRSGIFVSWPSTVATITGNEIGVASDGTPAPNGASGVYLASNEADVNDNLIANNGEFGIAVDRKSRRVDMHRNRIFGNGHTAIDIGLDLETPNVADDSGTVPNKPVLLSARFDPASGNTVVRGRIDTAPLSGFFPMYLVEVFASRSRNANGHAQAERYLGELRPASGHADFEFSVKGDLTGQWIAATSSRSFYNGFGNRTPVIESYVYPEQTSELSEAIEVR
jgi:hypothetical protein